MTEIADMGAAALLALQTRADVERKRRLPVRSGIVRFPGVGCGAGRNAPTAALPPREPVLRRSACAQDRVRPLRPSGNHYRRPAYAPLGTRLLAAPAPCKACV